MSGARTCSARSTTSDSASKQEELATAGDILQIVLGRILAPMTALEDLARALRGQPGHDLSAEELAAVTELAQHRRGPRVRRRTGADPGHDHRPDRLSAAVSLGPAAGR